MGKGVIWGGLSGLLAGVAMLAIASLAVPLPRLAVPPAAAPDRTIAAAPAPAGQQPGTAPAAPSAPQAPAAPQEPVPDSMAGGTDLDRMPAPGAIATPEAPPESAPARPPLIAMPEATAPSASPSPDAPAAGQDITTALPQPLPQKDAGSDETGLPETDTETKAETETETAALPATGDVPPGAGAIEIPGASDFARAGEDRAPVTPLPDAPQPQTADPATPDAGPRDALPTPGAAVPAPSLALEAPAAPSAQPDPGSDAPPKPAPATGDRLARALPAAPQLPGLAEPAPAPTEPAPAVTEPPGPPQAEPDAAGLDTTVPDPASPDEAPAGPQDAAGSPAAGLPEPGTGFRPVPGFADAGPRPGFAPTPSLAQGAAPAPDAMASEAAADAATGSPLALRRNAAESAPASGPLMSVVLMDEGPATRPDPALLADLPFPVTIAVDPAAPGAAEAAGAYRAAGLEVMILAGSIPETATPADLEVSWQSFLYAVPEAIGVMDLPAARVQNTRPLARQLVTLAAAGGYGVLSWDVGLDPLAQIARSEAVPELRIYRRLDGADEAAAVIGRYLDRAAFEATRNPGIIVAGAAHPATIAAILDWAVSQRRNLTLVPVSAQLQQQLP